MGFRTWPRSAWYALTALLLMLILLGAVTLHPKRPKHVTKAPSPITSSVPPPSPVASGSKYPADILDLRYFDLTLPVAGSNGYAREVKQPELSSFRDSYFSSLPDNSGVAFRANCGGATTTGSHFPRSELREMVGNTTKASWSTTVGSSDMKLTESIDHLPAKKPMLVFAQIHNASDDLVEAEISGSKMYLNHNGTTYGDLADSYVLGTRFDLEIKVESGVVTVLYNGVEKVSVALNDSGDYFKAGAYVQSSPSFGDAANDYGQVNIYKIQVTHG